jgi:type III restriction enzyme
MFSDPKYSLSVHPGVLDKPDETTRRQLGRGWTLLEWQRQHGVSPPWFRNAPGQEVTVRIDSKVIEDIEEGGTKDETRRLRFILDTVGKAQWPGGKIPDDWAELVRKHNEKAASEDNDGSLKWMDERVPLVGTCAASCL